MGICVIGGLGYVGLVTSACLAELGQRFAEGAGYEPAFLRAILEKNEHQVRQVVRRAVDMLQGDLYARTIAVFGLSFKPGTSDVRNSLAVRIVDRLRRRGAIIHCHDPVANGEAREVLGDVVLFDDPYGAARGCHLVLVLTAWEEFRQLDLARLRKEVALPLIVDGVNVLDPVAAHAAGFVYRDIGRSETEERTGRVLVSLRAGPLIHHHSGR